MDRNGMKRVKLALNSTKTEWNVALVFEIWIQTQGLSKFGQFYYSLKGIPKFNAQESLSLTQV